MNTKSIIQKSKLSCLIIMLIFSILTLGSDENQKFPIKLNSTSTTASYKEMEQMDKELSQLIKTTIQQRNELINKLINIIKEDKFRYTGVYDSMDLLGQIRATEATEILLDKIDYKDTPLVGIGFPAVSPKEFVRDYHAIRALINIRPQPESVMKRLRDEKYIVNYTCYVAVLVETEGPDVTRYLIEKAIHKEASPRSLERLNSALNTLNKYYPKDNNDVKPK